jgi:hypothetical protein
LPILSHCIKLFNAGFIEGHSKKDNYSFVVSGLKNIGNIYVYFDKYYSCFLGIKKQSYDKFKFLNNQFSLKKHLDTVERNKLVKLASEVNSISRKFK